MALEGNLCPYQCSMGWDLPSFEVFNADISLDLLSPLASDLSSGYLEDALDVKWSSRFKRRRTLSYPSDTIILPEFSKQSFCSSESPGNQFESSSFLRQKSLGSDHEEEPKSGLQTLVFQDDSTTEITKDSTRSPKPNPGGHKERDNALFSKTNKKVVYPFDMVKPGGIEGDMTLKDINERILMRPTRPVRHPVGDSACRPFYLTSGFGPSGKAVATLTRIHTQGRGSVTIITTRG